ncbi:MAG: type II toxin-antitoxin system VapC family toxin [Candidatus Aminicenantes bacterium]
MEEQINTTYVIDACAFIAYLRNEEGGDKFSTLLKDQDNRFFMHSINLGEVYYDSLRVLENKAPGELFDDIAKLPIHIIWTLDIPFIKLVGKYKTSYRISYADSFVLALAERENAIVISTDHEFDVIEEEGKLSFYWLREKI